MNGLLIIILPQARSGSAKQRWTKLKIVTRCGMIMRNKIEKKKNYVLPVKASVQDAFVSDLCPTASRRKVFRPTRLDSQLGLHHHIVLPSDEAGEESLGEVEGLLSNRHKQLLIKFLAKKESRQLSGCDSLPPDSSVHTLKRLQLERLDSKLNKVPGNQETAALTGMQDHN